MPDLVEPVIYRFDNFLLCKQAGTLVRLQPDGRKSPVQIGARAFQILSLLLDRRGEIVSRREIMDAVWSNIAVEQNNLTVQLAALRRVLDADRDQGSYIQNIPGQGYRFLSIVTQEYPGETDNNVATPPRPADPGPSAEPSLAAAVPSLPIRRWSRRTIWVAISCMCILALLLSAIEYAGRTPVSRSKEIVMPVAPVAAPATPASRVAASLAERPRLSLVVLPFENLDGNPTEDYLADIIVDELTTDLSRFAGAFLIARASAFAYKGKPIDIKRIGDELGVRYAVQGSVRKIGDKLRINAQLISTETSEQLWASRFDVERDGIGYNVDDIVVHIVTTLRFRMVDVESTRGVRERPANPDVADILLRARALNNLPPNLERQAQIVALYERAMELDPSSATALGGLAWALIDTTFPDAEDPMVPAKFRRAEELLTRAERIRPDEMTVMYARALLLLRQNRCPEVIPAAEKVSSAYPLLSGPYSWQAICLLRDGRSAEAIPKIELSNRVNPLSGQMFTRHRLRGYALLLLGRYDEAIPWLQKSLAAYPSDSARDRATTHAAIAAAQALAGHTEEARQSADQASQLRPTLTVRSFFQPANITNPIARAQVSRMHDGLRLAGVRDHVNEDADPGVPPDDILRSSYEAPTPVTVPGAWTIRTSDLVALMEQRKPLVLDTFPWGKTVPGAVGLWGAGIGGTMSDEFQDRLREKMWRLTRGDLNMPLVTMGWNAERFQGRNLALRLAALGYTEVYWYRGGREAWQLAGLPATELVTQDW